MIVDGYNVIRTTEAYAGLTREDWTGGPGLNAAREALIADVAVAAQGEYDATVVFDGAGNVESQGEPMSVAGITVIYSRAGQTADSVIEILARRARERGDEVLVVTSDAQTQWAVMGESVTRMSSAGFAGVVKQVNSEWREKNPAHVVKNTVSERIDPGVAAKLEAFVKGNGTL